MDHIIGYITGLGPPHPLHIGLRTGDNALGTAPPVENRAGLSGWNPVIQWLSEELRKIGQRDALLSLKSDRGELLLEWRCDFPERAGIDVNAKASAFCSCGVSGNSADYERCSRHPRTIRSAGVTRTDEQRVAG